MGSINYTYDFGDDWRFLIIHEDTLEDYYFGYPTLISGEGTAPLEDVGGIPGYYEFLKIYNDVNHKDYLTVLSWSKEHFYREFDVELINRKLKGIKYKKTQWDKLTHINHVVES